MDVMPGVARGGPERGAARARSREVVGDLGGELAQQRRRHPGGGVDQGAGAAAGDLLRPAGHLRDQGARRSSPRRSAARTSRMPAVALMQTPHCRALSAARNATASAAASTGQSSAPSSANEPQPRPLPIARRAPWVSGRDHGSASRPPKRPPTIVPRRAAGVHAVPLDQRAEAYAERHLDQRRSVPVVGERGQERVPGGGVGGEQRDVGQRLDVLHQGGRAADAGLERARRLRRRQRGAAVDGPDQRALLAGDVGVLDADHLDRDRPQRGGLVQRLDRTDASHDGVGDVDDGAVRAGSRRHQA